VTTRGRPHLAALVLMAIALAGCGSSGDDAAARDGDRLPDVEIQRIPDGETISLTDIEGPAVVNLWATWCAPCRREIPDFEAVHQARGDEVYFVGVNIGEDEDRAADFVDDVGASYDQFLDSQGYVVTELRTSTMPVTLVIDADGLITTRHLGPMDQSDLNDAIDEAFAVNS
jgi:thiol-disulfide isomerase/thioredoxin